MLKLICKNKLKKIFDKKNIHLVRRGNKAIQILLRELQSYSRNLLIQDQGGWMTYEPFGKKLGFNVIKLKTNNGIIEKLPSKYRGSILILHSMPGYHSLQDMSKLQRQARKLKIKIINDASGSILTKEGKIGDYILVSSNKDKPLNYERIGIIATNNKLNIRDYEAEIKDEINFKLLNRKLTQLKKRMDYLKSRKEEAIKFFKDKKNNVNFEIVEDDGINFIVLGDEQTRKKAINICESNKYEYTLCPRYIRLERPGISVEIKRL